MPLAIISATSTACVTGATGGIGTAFSRELARKGYNLVLLARTASALEDLAARLSAEYGIKADIIAVDLTDPSQRVQCIQKLQKYNIDILCNNAGIATFGTISDLDSTQEKLLVSLNAIAVHELTLELLPAMISRRTGGIINVGSSAGDMPIPGNASYAATKAFVNSFSQSLHYELRRTGVNVTLLSPGPVRPAQKASRNFIDKVIPDFLWVSADKAVQDGLRGLEKNKRKVVPGVLSKLLVLLGYYAPTVIVLPIVAYVYSLLAKSADQQGENRK